MPTKQEIIHQIDRAIELYEEHRARSHYDDLSDLGYDVHTEVDTIAATTVNRCAPVGSPYRTPFILKGRIGALRALRRDYEDGYLSSIEGLIRADLFADFLEMADHLLDQGYKDPAAVLVGGVLEEHLRALCSVRAIAISLSGRTKTADAMNNELAAAPAYNKLDQKSVIAWLDLRNKAAHAKYGEYNAAQVTAMLSGVREFINRVPAV